MYCYYVYFLCITVMLIVYVIFLCFVFMYIYLRANIVIPPNAVTGGTRSNLNDAHKFDNICQVIISKARDAGRIEFQLEMGDTT